MEELSPTANKSELLNQIRYKIKVAYEEGCEGEPSFSPQSVEKLLNIIDELSPSTTTYKRFSGMVDVYEVNNLIESCEVIGTSIEDVKEFANTNKDFFDFDLSEYFTVEKSPHDYTLNVEFKPNSDDINHVNLVNNHCNSQHDNILYTVRSGFILAEGKR